MYLIYSEDSYVLNYLGTSPPTAEAYTISVHGALGKNSKATEAKTYNLRA